MPLRPATAADWHECHRVRMAVRENRLSDPARVTEADYAAALTTRGRGWLVEEAGRVCGFAIAYADGHIWALFVDPPHEGRCIAQRLHAAMTEWLWSLGLAQLTLSTEPGTRAERFYRAQGWQPVGLTGDGRELRFVLPRPRDASADAAA